MSNQKKLEKYLVGANGYLKNDISNGKVIMLSGKWGSGKTHFWKNKIQTVLNNEEKEIPNNYISLYGKTSIQEIKNEVFLKIFKSVDSSELEEKGINLAKNTVDLISLFTKSVGIDLSKLTDKPFENLEKIFENKKLEKTVEYLNSGAIICFDDFERKSKDIDLNDLFGFITNLTIEFKSKVVIILNDDVFEGEEKKIFLNVKEKSVSKFLKYEPSIKDLFGIIFNNDRYRTLDNHKEIILKTIEDIQELNARIYIQVLDNLVEWIEGTNIHLEDYIRYFVSVNINFILNHYILIASCLSSNCISSNKDGIEIVKSSTSKFGNIKFSLNTDIKLPKEMEKYLSERSLGNLKNKIYIEEKEMLKRNVNAIDNSIALIDFVDKNENLIKSLMYMQNIYSKAFLKGTNQEECDIFNKINNFIESGILINE